MTINKHSQKVMHRGTGKSIQRREIREQMAECVVTGGVKQVKK